MKYNNERARIGHISFWGFCRHISLKILRSVLAWGILFSLTMIPSGAMAQNEGDLADGLYAKMDTDKGTILLELFYKQAPLTVTNFAATMLGLMLMLLFVFGDIFSQIGLYIVYLGVVLTVVSGVDYYIKNKHYITKSI